MSEPLITIRDLRYRYAGASEDVLRIPFLDLSGSGLIAITGPSGAGKTTLVELLAGTLHEPYEGSLKVLGKEWKDLRRDDDRQRQLRRIGFIPQDYGLLPSWTPKRTLEQDLSDAQVPAKECDMRVQASLAQVGLSDFAERDIGTLSGGQRQRVAIARMLARDVELVIADEPTANLDPDLVADIAGLLKELARKVPVIVVTHDPRMAEMCDRTIVLQAAVQPQTQALRAEVSSKTGTRRRHGAALWVAVALLLAAGAASASYVLTHKAGSKSAHAGRSAQTVAAQAPSPDLAAFLPKNYRVVRVVTASLDGGPVPNQVVLSEGPIAQYGVHQQDVQILAWDPVAKRWNLAFDARATPQLGGASPDETNDWPFASLGSWDQSLPALLPRDRADQVDQLRTVNLGPGVGEVLLFTADVNAGANAPSELVVVGFVQGTAQVEYCWYGEGMPQVHVLGPSSDQRIRVAADLFSPVDREAAPVRVYHFILQSASGQVQAVSDDRPWLGVYVTAVSPSSTSSPLVVADTVPGSPAAGILRRGDVILSIDGQPISRGADTLGPSMVDQLEALHAGATVAFEINRQGQDESIEVTLGSVLDPSAQNVYAPDNQPSVIVL